MIKWKVKFKNAQNLETSEWIYQQIFTCSKSLIENLEKCVKFVQS